MRRPKQLSATFLKTVNEPGRYGDGRGGHGLSLLVKPTSTGRLSKSWSQRLRIAGRPVNIGLGAYPVVTLAAARAAALENRRAVFEGRDPRTAVGGIPTFAQAAETVIAMHEAAWRRGKRRDNGAASKDYAHGPRADRDRRINQDTTPRRNGRC